MNLLKDPFISTTEGKVSLKDILTTDHDYQLQYFFDETQLAMLQMLASLTTVVLNPTIAELKIYLSDGLTAEQYDQALDKIETKWFEDDCFMQSTFPSNTKIADGPITKLVSGVECGGSPNALGLFSENKDVSVACADCVHVLNYNLHMNIKGECFGPTGATGIRGGGTISTLIAGNSLKETILANVVAYDFFSKKAQLDSDADSRYMWDNQPSGTIYSANKIGLNRGLFALAYHIKFPLEDRSCVCHICGHLADKIATTFQRVKFTGAYGSTKNGRDGGAGWWLHPYSPRSITDNGESGVSPRDQNWHSWQELTSYIVGKETDKVTIKPAFITNQFQNELTTIKKMNLLVGGNIADQGSITGRVYDLYSMPSSLIKNHGRIGQVINVGLEQKDKLSGALNKLFGIGYDKNFVGGIKDQAMQRFTANAQQMIQQILLDVDRKEATQLRREAVLALNQEAKTIFKSVQRKYQHDLPMFKALVKGEYVLNKTHSQ